MISVIVPAYNEEEVIGQCLQALLDQNYSKKYEIIVVDDGSTDNTRNVVKKFKKVKIIRQRHKGPAAARNFGVKKAKGQIILFTDADCVPSKNWIKKMLKPFEDNEIVGVAGTYKTLNKDNLIARFVGYEIEDRHEKLNRKKYIDFIGSYSAAYRKNIFLKFGGFDESFPVASGEDPELSFKMSEAGLKMLFQPKAHVYHKHPDSLSKFLKQKFWRGYWRVWLYKKHKKKIFKHAYTPQFIYFEIFLIGITLLSLFLGFLKAISLFYGTFLLFLVFILTIPLSLNMFRKDKILGPLSPIIIILRDIAIGMGIIYGFKLLFRK